MTWVRAFLRSGREMVRVRILSASSVLMFSVMGVFLLLG